MVELPAVDPFEKIKMLPDLTVTLKELFSPPLFHNSFSCHYEMLQWAAPLVKDANSVWGHCDIFVLSSVASGNRECR